MPYLCSQLRDGTTPAEGLWSVWDAGSIFWTDHWVCAHPASPGPPRTAPWHWGSLADGFPELLGQRGSLRKPLDAQLQKPTADSFQGTHFTSVKLASPWAQLYAENWKLKKYIFQTSDPHLCKVTASCAAHFPNLLENTCWLMQEQPWKAPRPGLRCAHLTGGLRHKGFSWTHHSVHGPSNSDSTGMVKDKVWSLGGFFCFAQFPAVCNATLTSAFSVGKTHPMNTNWIKCCSAVSLMSQVFCYSRPLHQWLICFSLWNYLHIPSLWLQSTSLVPTLSAGILFFPHGSETPLTFLPAVPKIV